MKQRSDRPPANLKEIKRSFWVVNGHLIVKAFSRTIYFFTENWQSSKFDKKWLSTIQPDRIDKFYKGDV